MSEAIRKKVIVVGGGFGGLTVAKGLGGHKNLDIKLIDRRNYHLFQPLLYQVAMAGLSPAEIAIPLRSLLSGYSNVEVILGNVESVNLEQNCISADCGMFPFDYLVLACGAKHSYFGNESWEEYAPGLKTLEQATEIRRRVLMAFEQAEIETNSELQKASLTFVVVGGGPTGVELAGALGEISRYTLTKDFRKIDPNRTRVILIEAGERVLQSFSPELSVKCARSLEGLGVQVWTKSRVTEVNGDGVYVGSEFIQAKTVLWAAGVKPSSLNDELNTECDSSGKVKVAGDLSLPNYRNVFVIGDQAFSEFGEGMVVPGTAPSAIQMGQSVTRNILA